MSKHSLRWFWYILILTALFVNENLIYWILAVTAGNYNVAEAYNKTFKYFTFRDYAFFTAIRLIPYLILALVVVILKTKKKKAKTGIAWGGLIGIVSMIVYESWIVQLPFFTSEHASSTTGLAFLVIPFFAIVTGIIGSLTGWAISSFISKRNGENKNA